MTRIGFAYNQKPGQADPSAAVVVGGARDEALDSDEPPSISDLSPGGEAVMTAAPDPDDQFAEWDSAETIDAVARALSALGTVVRLEATADFPARLRAERPDIVFNVAEGLAGANREAHVPAICEFFGIPYSGSDPLTLSLCLDKARTKQILAYHGVPTAPFRVVDRIEAVAGVESLRYPLFVKPLYEGSSKGITERNLCRTPAETDEQVRFLLERYAEPVLVEEYLPGDEFTCAILGNGDGAQVLPLIGMDFGALPPGALPIYGFEAKWLWDRPERPLRIFECPAAIDDDLRGQIERVSLAAYHALACRDWARVDVRLDGLGVPHVVEINPLPGILPDPSDNSCFPKAARAAGLGYDELIQTCCRLAAERQGVRL
jgi:D-alanine-D-alanine ligase